MTAIRTAVVGLGYFGRFHARHHAASRDGDLVAVCDADAAAAARVAAEFGGEALTDHRDLIGRVDAASIAVPTSHHAAVARDLMAAGIHVFIEKPVTETLEEASELIALAERQRLVLQVGHVESFSAVFRALKARVGTPHYIEAVRVAPWRGRATDVSVVLDLMIHDIDLVIALAGAAPERVEGVGLPLLSDAEDTARARLVFPGGAVADITASRVADSIDRRLRVHEATVIHECDFASHKLHRKFPEQGEDGHAETAIRTETVDVPREDALGNEIAEFLDCVRHGRRPSVDGQRGREALRVAQLVMEDARTRRRTIGGGGDAAA